MVQHTLSEYYRLEEQSPSKSDYYEGEILATAGGTMRHSLISTNITAELRQRLRGKPCTAFESNLRLGIKGSTLRTYPDANVYCQPFETADDDPSGLTFTNPVVLFEVLSPSTEAYDRGTKAQSYRLIDSLRAYVLVSQRAPHLEIYERDNDGMWKLRDLRGLDETLKLPAIGVEIPIAEIYQGVDFSKV